MLIVLAEATMGDGALDAARDAMATMLAASRAEDGCISYAYSIDVLDPAKLHITEKWDDEAALAFHFQTPHMAAFQAALGKLDIKINELAKFQTDGGKPVM